MARAITTKILEMELMMDHIYKAMFKLREELYAEVVHQCLGRSFSPEDATRFEFIIDHKKREFISFDGGIVGEIKMTQNNTENMHLMGWEFIPKTTI